MIFSRFAVTAAFALFPSVAHGAGGAFSYEPDAEDGPANWYKLAIDGNACDGKKNSPIAVQTHACDRYENYDMVDGSCTTSDLVYELTPTGMKASYPDGCQGPTVQIPGIAGTYKALQFHIHTSSEHTIDGQFYGAELHTVHQEVGGDRYAVVGFMIQPSSDSENALFQRLLDGWDEVFQYNDDECQFVRGGSRRELSAERRLAQAPVVSPYMFIPEGATFYHYDGGLTTPPCSEVVWWNLADKPVAISPAQYNQLMEQVLEYTDIATCTKGTYAGVAGSTSRPPQPLNGRYVERICPKGFVEEGATSGAFSATTLGVAAIAGAAFLL